MSAELKTLQTKNLTAQADVKALLEEALDLKLEFIVICGIAADGQVHTTISKCNEVLKAIGGLETAKLLLWKKWEGLA